MDGPKERLHFNAVWEGRDVEISVTPSGVLVCESARPLDPAAETFYHYTTVPSWRVVRAYVMTLSCAVSLLSAQYSTIS